MENAVPALDEAGRPHIPKQTELEEVIGFYEVKL